MTNNEKLELAKQFVDDMELALDAEVDYFSEGNQDVIKLLKAKHERYLVSYNRYGSYYKRKCPFNNLHFTSENIEEEPVWDDKSPCPLSKIYPEKFEQLHNRTHPFQKLIDKDDSYLKALTIFSKKRIYIPLSYRYKRKELPPIQLEPMLDRLVAHTIIRWEEIKTNGIERYVPANKAYADTIEKKALELLNAIEVAPDVISNQFSKTVLRELDAMAHGYNTLSYRYINKPGFRKPKKLNLSHIKAGDIAFSPNVNHPKADREFLLRELISNYMNYFGSTEFVNKPEDALDGELINPVCRMNTNATYGKNTKNKIWIQRESLIIHADVIAELIIIIDDSFDGIDERAIKRYAKTQKEIDKARREKWNARSEVHAKNKAKDK